MPCLAITAQDAPSRVAPDPFAPLTQSAKAASETARTGTCMSQTSSPLKCVDGPCSSPSWSAVRLSVVTMPRIVSIMLPSLGTKHEFQTRLGRPRAGIAPRVGPPRTDPDGPDIRCGGKPAA